MGLAFRTASAVRDNPPIGVSALIGVFCFKLTHYPESGQKGSVARAGGNGVFLHKGGVMRLRYRNGKDTAKQCK